MLAETPIRWTLSGVSNQVHLLRFYAGCYLLYSTPPQREMLYFLLYLTATVISNFLRFYI